MFFLNFQQLVVSWLSQHNFPLGLIYFADGISTDFLKHKADYLRCLNQKVKIKKKFIIIVTLFFEFRWK